MNVILIGAGFLYLSLFVVYSLTLNDRYLGGSIIDVFIDTTKTFFLLIALIFVVCFPLILLTSWEKEKFMLESTEEFKVISEEEQENGDLVITFEVSGKLLEALIEKYGEDFQEPFNRDFIEYLKNLIKTAQEV